MAIHLEGSGDSLRLICSVATPVHVTVSYMHRAGSSTTADAVEFSINSAAEQTILTPSGSNQLVITYFSAVNRGTVATALRVYKEVSATEYDLFTTVTLQVGDAVIFDSDGWTVYNSGGRTEEEARVESLRPIGYYKAGGGPEATGANHSLAAANGFPGAWSPGAPGINGRTTDGETAADGGCLPIVWPGSGYLTLSGVETVANVAGQLQWWDVLWVNTGIVVTTTGAQAIVTPTLPARDLNGATDGDGVYAAILVTTATTNAGAITNMTISYTNQDGTAGRTGTMPSFAATAVIGYVALFTLQAGDSGIRSIENITLGTSLVTGAVSLLLFRWLASGPVITANTPSSVTLCGRGARLYDGVCALPFWLASSTTAPNVQGNVYIAENA